MAKYNWRPRRRPRSMSGLTFNTSNTSIRIGDGITIRDGAMDFTSNVVNVNGTNLMGTIDNLSSRLQSLEVTTLSDSLREEIMQFVQAEVRRTLETRFNGV